MNSNRRMILDSSLLTWNKKKSRLGNADVRREDYS
jgi:hypothetical protein